MEATKNIGCVKDDDPVDQCTRTFARTSIMKQTQRGLGALRHLGKSDE